MPVSTALMGAPRLITGSPLSPLLLLPLLLLLLDPYPLHVG
jgi:hypothetical protein